MSTQHQSEYERYVRTCKLRGCLKRGYYQPWLYFSADALTWRVLKLTRFLFCEDHKRDIGPEDLITGKGLIGENVWTSIEGAFATHGLPVPLKELTLMEWRDG